MHTSHKTMKAMNKRAMRKARGGSGVGALVFSNRRDNANPNGGVKCEHTNNNPEPRQGPMQNV